MAPSLLAVVLLAAQAVASSPRLSDERIVFRTTRGDLVVALYPDVAPRHTAQILRLVRLGVYDSTYVHRVEPGFVAQLTNAQNRKRPLSPEQTAAIVKLPAELSAVPHREGVLSMAREDGDLDSAETSFSFMLGPAPHLDGKYTVFGQLEFGQPLLDMLSREPRGAGNAPRDPPVVEQATVVSTAEYLRRRAAGELRPARPLDPALAAPEPAPPSPDFGPLAVGGIAFMIACNLALFAFGGRWRPQTQAAMSMVAVLIGAFVLFARFGSGPRRAPLVGLVLFFGAVGLFKLMNRFESAPRPDRKT
jgi:cyclophilin family peptidyl-prolyl cis-trans isomerase